MDAGEKPSGVSESHVQRLLGDAGRLLAIGRRSGGG
jgi:hypothetical protein